MRCNIELSENTFLLVQSHPSMLDQLIAVIEGHGYYADPLGIPMSSPPDMEDDLIYVTGRRGVVELIVHLRDGGVWEVTKIATKPPSDDRRARMRAFKAWFDNTLTLISRGA